MTRRWDKKSNQAKTPRRKAVSKRSPAKRKAPPKKKAAARAKAPAKKTPAKKTAAKKKAPVKKPVKKKAVRKPRPAAPEKKARSDKPFRHWLTGTWPRRIAGSAVILAGLFFLTTLSWVIVYGFVDPPITVLMLARNMSEDIPIEKRWRDYGEISPHMKLAVLCAEDQRFPDHHGFDLKEMRNAIETRLDGGSMRGASTITQQVVKNVFLWPDRSFLRKSFEAYFTVLVELFWGKERILEVYLNVAEMGTGIYGAESAAQAYFMKSATDLSREEAALLAAILPNPRVMSPVQPDDKVRRKQQWILTQMHNLGGTAYLRKLEGAE